MKQENFFKVSGKDSKGSKFFSKDPHFWLSSENFPTAFFEIVGLYAEDADGELEDVECLSGALTILGRGKDGTQSKLYMNYTAEEEMRSVMPYRGDPVNVNASQGGYSGPVTANFPPPRYEGLVLDYVRFVHQRQGYMNRLFEILKRIQSRYDLGPIRMANVISDGMIAWCEKKGLEKVMRGEKVNYYYYGKDK